MNTTFRPFRFSVSTLVLFMAILAWAGPIPESAAAAKSGSKDDGKGDGPGKPPRGGAGPVLILHDSAGAFGWVGGVHARMLANLLGHFDLPYRIVAAESYPTGAIAQARAVFYLGTTYDNPLPDRLQQDILSTAVPVCWFKYNLWRLGAGPGSAFAGRFGFQFDALDSSGYDTVSYKGETLSKSPLDLELGRTTLLASGPATVAAWACRGDTTNCIPYAVRSSNFWYIADSPFSFISEEDRYVVFCDLLHDILGIPHAESHRALVRIEDVDPATPPESVVAVADYLKSENVPFLINLIPVYRDPNGAYHSGVSTTVRLSEAPAMKQALRHAVANGGQILLHGFTHQFDSVTNPYTGASGDDYEFFRVTLDAAGGYAGFSPVPGDSYAWAMGRARASFREARRAGLSVAGWSTPHYVASAQDYTAFGDFFPLTVQRAVYFDNTGATSRIPGRGERWNDWPQGSGKGESGKNSGKRKHGNDDRKGKDAAGGKPAPEPAFNPAHFGSQFFPYVIQNDIYGQKVVPENLGKVDLPVLNGSAVRQPADMVRMARKHRVVRDGWASGFFHPFLDLGLLRELVAGLKAEGYTFVPLKQNVK